MVYNGRAKHFISHCTSKSMNNMSIQELTLALIVVVVVVNVDVEVERVVIAVLNVVVLGRRVVRSIMLKEK
jgi:hypothetical protein